jgi:hypothetical protein
MGKIRQDSRDNPEEMIGKIKLQRVWERSQKLKIRKQKLRP